MAVDLLRSMWRDNLTPPWSDRSRDEWSTFMFRWLWCVAGVVPGALTAAYVIGHFHIIDQNLQNGVSVALCFLSMVLVEVIAVFGVGLLVSLIEIAQATHDHLVGQLLQAVTRHLITILQLGPFLLAGSATWWYFTHPSASADVAATGAGGALVLKVLLILINAVVRPAIQGVLLKHFWHWLMQDGDTKPREV